MNCDGIVKNPGGITKTALVLCAPKGAAYLTSEGRLLVCLVRHGQTDWNIERRLQGREPVPLNAVGIEQSEKCGELFTAAREAGLEIDKAYTSPLGRAEETANAITDALGMGRAERVEALIERDYGALSGLSLDERRALYKSGKTDSGVEPISSTAARIKGWLADVAREKRGGAVLAITHGGVINALYSCITRGMIGTGKNISENCGVSLLAAGADATIPLAYGLTGDMFLEYIRDYYAARNDIDAAV